VDGSHGAFRRSAGNIFVLSAAIVGAVLIGGIPIQADEPHAEFINGLRERKFFDTTLEYVDNLAKRVDLPAELTETLDLERGVTYREMAAASRVPEDRDQALTRAEQALKKFTSEHPGHTRAAYANSELGELLFERARSLIWDAESPSNADKTSQLQQQARSLIEQAKAIYQTAHDQYETKYKAFPSFIDRTTDEEAFLERQSAEVKYLRAWFSLVRCTYERGQTFPKGSKERNETMVRASTEFEAIHTARRSNPIGLQSRLMMGKCFQEQDDLNRALGIYNEMLSHKSEHATVQFLKSIALQYRLICLNHEKKNDFQLVLQEAEAWLQDKSNRKRIYSEIGLGILWEKTIAEEKLGQDRAMEARLRNTMLRQALTDSKQVARFPGPYREPAVAMGRRLNAELGEKDAVPKDFDTAFERARGMVSQLKGLGEDLQKAKSSEEKQKAKQAVDFQLNEIGRLFALALSLRDQKTDTKAIAQARYLLSYVYMRQRKSFDAIILARYCMTTDRLNDPDSALSATEIAIEAAVQAFNDADADKKFELDLLKEICELIVEQYPQSARGNEARIRLGQVYRDLNDPLNAAKTYLSVPSDYSEYGSARMQAGQSYWLAWVTAMSDLESGDQPERDEESIKKWKADAAVLMLEGITVARAKLGANAKPTPEIVAAEVSLATINNMNGQFAETIKRLTAGGDNSVLKMLEVAQGQTRPEKGITSSAFAGQAYRLLLRAYVGTQKVAEALQTMNKLEAVGGQDTAAVYTQLGQELQEELKRLKASGETEQLANTRKSFEQFLAKVSENRENMDYNSLVWIGETYFGLGQGTQEDVVAASGYYQNAHAAYQDILDRNLAEGGSVIAVKLRIVRCRRAQGQFEEGVSLAQSILNETPLSLDVQFEAAYTLSDWGAADGGQPDKLLAAIEGVENAQGEKSIWGWSGITRKLQARQSSPDWEQLKDRFLEARYEYVNSRYRYAKTGASDGDVQLKSGLAEITIFVQVFTDLDDAWFAKFDRLYQNTQLELGQPQTSLERPVAPEVVMAQSEPDGADESQQQQAAETAVTPPPEGTSMIVVVVLLALAAGGGFGFYKLMSKPQQRRRPTLQREGSSFTAPPGAGDSDTGGAPDFGALEAAGGAAVAAPPRKKKVASKASPQASSASQQRPAKKKRVLTPEEAARYKAAKAAKARAAAASGAGGDTAAAKNKAVKKVRKRSASDSAAAPKKKVRKRPPQPPAE
jgi:cellulose synthase operon protein C